VVKLWHPGTGQELFTLLTHPQPVLDLAFSRDGRALVAGTRSKEKGGPSSLLLWRAEPTGP
jgi:WD40 repeat protein